MPLSAINFQLRRRGTKQSSAPLRCLFQFILCLNARRLPTCFLKLIIGSGKLAYLRLALRMTEESHKHKQTGEMLYGERKKKKGSRVQASGRRELLFKDSFSLFQNGLMPILLFEGSLECCSHRQAHSFTPGHLTVGQSLSGTKRLLPHLTSSYLTKQQRGGGQGVGGSRSKERCRPEDHAVKTCH